MVDQYMTNMTAKDFFVALFDGKDDNHWIYTWELDKWGKGKHKTTPFLNIRQAAEYVEKNKKNCFFGVATARVKPGSRSGRPLAEHASGLPGLYIDIDIADPQAHDNNKKYPPSIDNILTTLEKFPLKASLIVNSGHGIHAYWLFKEVWHFDSDEEQKKAAVLMQRFQMTIKSLLKEQGWDCDSTFDLARVLRPVGSVNKKRGLEGIDVATIDYDENRRFNPDDFDEFLLQPTRVLSGSGSGLFGKTIKTPSDSSQDPRSQSGLYGDTDQGKIVAETASGLVYDTKRSIDPDRFMGLKEVFDPEFTLTWNKERDDQLNDNSLSGYDYALINYAIKGGFTDQEIIDLCVTFRRKHGGKNKYLKYYVVSIQRARNTLQSELVDAAVDEAATLAGTSFGTKDYNRTILCKRLGIDNIRIIMIKEDPPIYRMEVINNGKKKFMQTKNEAIFNQGCLFADKLSWLIRKPIIFKKNEFKSKIWPLILEIIEDVQPDIEATDTGRVSLWISEYLSQKTTTSIDAAVSSKAPFFHIDGYWYIFLDGLHTYAREILYEKIEKNDLRRLLIQIGCEKKIFHVNHSERQTTATTFKVPKELSPVFCDTSITKQQEYSDNISHLQEAKKTNVAK
jgi:hypothetical protein